MHASTNYVTTVSGGGGTVGKDMFGNTRGRIDPVQSTTTRHDELHVKYDNGHEEVVRTAGADIQVRPGNDVAVIWGGVAGKKSYYHLAVRNLNTRVTHAIDSTVPTLVPATATNMMVLVTFLTGAVIANNAKSGVLFALIAVVPSAWLFKRLSDRRRTLRNAVLELARRAQSEST